VKVAFKTEIYFFGVITFQPGNYFQSFQNSEEQVKASYTLNICKNKIINYGAEYH